MKKLHGITVALITPLDRKTGAIDVPTMEKHIEMLVQKGVDCIYCCGTDSEMYHLTTDERKQIAETVVKTVDGRVVVYVHCGAMLMEDTLDLAAHAESIGADGIGVVTPTYYPATEDELIAYYSEIAQSVSPDFPVYVYNIPQLAVNDIHPNTVQKIVDANPNVVGIKYNYPDINQTIDYLSVNKRDFSVLQGDDRALPAWLALGCDGTVAGSANVFPEPLVASYAAFKQGDLDAARAHSQIAAAFVDAMENDNIAYFKAGLKARGFDVGGMRKPLSELSGEEESTLKDALARICSDAGIELSLS